MKKYDFQDLLSAYECLGVAPGRIVYATGNLGLLGPSVATNKNELIESHYQALRELLGATGTLVVPTHSFSLCNTQTPFEYAETPSETGPLTEYVRTQKDAIRQFHPFASRAAIGQQAENICGSCSRHAYGRHTPFERMIERDALFVSIGLTPNLSCSIVHQCEFVMGVPYRYTKEFSHPVRYGHEIRKEIFYSYVLYREMELERDQNFKIFNHFQNQYQVAEEKVGKGSIFSYSMKEFFQATTELMKEDPYAWARRPPASGPYQQ